jgi:hypothetical protein
MESTPASTASLMPSPPWAWAAVLRPRLGARRSRLVNPQHADFHAVHQLGILDRAGEGIAGQAVRQAVGFAIASSRLSKPRIAATGPKGSSLNTLASSGTSARMVGAKKLPSLADALAAGNDLGALGLRILDHLAHRRHAARIGQRAQGRAVKQAVAQFQAFGMRTRRA